MKRYDQGGDVKLVKTLNQPDTPREAEAVRRQKVAETKAPPKDPDQSKYARGGKVSKHKHHHAHGGRVMGGHAPEHFKDIETPFVEHHGDKSPHHGSHPDHYKQHQDHVRETHHGK